MRNVKIVLSALGLLIGGAALAERQQLGDRDREFIEKAASGGMAEVRIGRLAETRASSPMVKEFGRRMVEDHSKANRSLQQLAARKNLTLPSSLGAEDQREYDRMSRLSGAEFDRVYMQMMVQDHDKDVAEFKRQAEEGQDPDLKQFARDTLPTLQEHQRLAREDVSRLGAQPMHEREQPSPSPRKGGLPPEQETPHQPGR